jgi:3-oxoadipate enol-lactonase/4-carboxymuconolactone decarboxylase
MPAIVDSVMQRFFTQHSIAANSPEVATTRRTFLATNPIGYAGCCAAIRDMDNRESLPKIQTPTLVIFSEKDLSTPWTANGEILAGSIPGAQTVSLPTAHLSNLEAPRSFTAALLNFVMPQTVASIEQGFAVRRQVLGDAHVDRAIANTTDLNREFQELITRYAWGTIWSRPQLDQRARRLLTLTALAALGRWEEFRMHLRTGFAHELEPCDVKEILLQISVYAGVPVANTGFHIAMEELQHAKNEKPG